jgi:hypothetical protein
MKYALLSLGIWLVSGAALAQSAAKGITWSSDYAEAQAQAAAEGKPLFLVLNMDGERANDFLAKEAYFDKTIVALSQESVNVVGSNFEHAKAGVDCPRFPGVTCAEHQACEQAIRKYVLKVANSVEIISPQHLFLNGMGDVILAVPYAISLPEMQWCFAAAFKDQEITSSVKLSPKRRAPKRLVMANVPDLPSAEEATMLTREEVLEFVDEIKRGTLRGAERRRALTQVVRSEEPEALEVMQSLLRKSPGGRRNRNDPRIGYLRDIGAFSPEPYWEMTSELISAGSDELRNQAIVALEQLGAEDSLKIIRKVAAKEKDPLILKNLLRAMASVGPGDKFVRKELFKRSRKERDELLRINAVVALGVLSPGDDLDEILTELSGDKELKIRMAAASAMAMTRDRAWIEVLTGMYAGAKDPNARRVLASVRLVYTDGDLRALGAILKELAGDKIERPRFFGRSQRGG